MHSVRNVATQAHLLLDYVLLDFFYVLYTQSKVSKFHFL